MEPLSINPVLSHLRILGSSDPAVRENQIAKAGPIKTDQDNFIVDAPFPTLLLPSDVGKDDLASRGNGEGGKWEGGELAREITAIEGVLSVGLFVGVNGPQALKRGDKTGGQKPVAAYFGMEDGSVVVREARDDGTAEVRGR